MARSFDQQVLPRRRPRGGACDRARLPAAQVSRDATRRAVRPCRGVRVPAVALLAAAERCRSRRRRSGRTAPRADCRRAQKGLWRKLCSSSAQSCPNSGHVTVSASRSGGRRTRRACGRGSPGAPRPRSRPRQPEARTRSPRGTLLLLRVLLGLLGFLLGGVLTLGHGHLRGWWSRAVSWAGARQVPARAMLAQRGRCRQCPCRKRPALWVRPRATSEAVGGSAHRGPSKRTGGGTDPAAAAPAG